MYSHDYSIMLFIIIFCLIDGIFCKCGGFEKNGQLIVSWDAYVMKDLLGSGVDVLKISTSIIADICDGDKRK